MVLNLIAMSVKKKLSKIISSQASQRICFLECLNE